MTNGETTIAVDGVYVDDVGAGLARPWRALRRALACLCSRTTARTSVMAGDEATTAAAQAQRYSRTTRIVPGSQDERLQKVL